MVNRCESIFCLKSLRVCWAVFHHFYLLWCHRSAWLSCISSHLSVVVPQVRTAELYFITLICCGVTGPHGWAVFHHTYPLWCHKSARLGCIPSHLSVVVSSARLSCNPSHLSVVVPQVRTAVAGIFNHLRKIRSTKYPIQRALKLVEAISRDLSSQILKVVQLKACVLYERCQFIRMELARNST